MSGAKGRIARIPIWATVGDVMDRLSIIGVKIEKMGKEPVLEDQYNDLRQCYNEWSGPHGSEWKNEIRKAYQQLVEVNTELWDLENEFEKWHQTAVVEEELAVARALEMANLACTIRDKNRFRALLKRKIDELVGHVPEVKQYGDLR